MNKPYTVERKKLSYKARFQAIAKPILLKAVNEYQARKMAEGIAKSNQWKLQSVGRA